jgi:hypothetical protein
MARPQTEADRGNKLSKGQLRLALTRLNNLYGRGDIVLIQYMFPDYIEVTVQKQYGQEMFKARVVNHTVFARGHQMTMKAGA